MADAGWWPHTDRADVASVRLRCLRIVEELRKRGKDAEVWSRGMASPRVLVMSKRYDPASVRHAAGLRDAFGTRLVLDLCDNHFYAKTPDLRWSVRADALREAIAAMDMVVASTPALADVIRDECGAQTRIRVIGDTVEVPGPPSGMSRWPLLAEFKLAKLRRWLSHRPVPEGRRLIWFGNAGDGRSDAGMRDLMQIRARVERAAAQAPATLTVISNDRWAYRRIVKDWAIDNCYLDWAASTFPRAAALHDIALIPVQINPFTVCKTNNRVATALLNGLAVVADSIPSYAEFAPVVVLDDWDAGLDAVMANSDSRRNMIARGARLVHERWNTERVVAQWAEALDL